MSKSWPYKYFRESEFLRPDIMSPELLDLLDRARALAGVPFYVNSSWRADSASHSRGVAVDLRAVDGETRFRMVQALMASGALRIGVYSVHVHVDVDSELPSPALWNGVSR